MKYTTFYNLNLKIYGQKVRIRPKVDKRSIMLLIFLLNLDGYYAEQNTMLRFSKSTFPSNVTTFNLEGVAYNWKTRALVVCGGKQVRFNQT